MIERPRIGELFSGYGGLGLGVQALYGGDIAWHSDIDKGACKILAHRYPGIPNLGDVTRVDWSTVEPVDILTGGTPCQDLSHAGRRAGLTEGTRSNLWVAMREAIAQLRPPMVVWENVRGAYSAKADSDLGSDPGLLDRVRHRAGQPLLRALGRILGDLADLGYDASWHGLRAADVGAPHGRFRVFITATHTGSETGELRPGLCAGLSGGQRGRRPDDHDRPALLLPTPTTQDAHNNGGAAQQQRHALPLNAVAALLPTPNDFHSQNTESPEEWLIRRAEVQERTGTRHGPALPVVAWSIHDGHPLIQAGDGPQLVDPGPDRWGPYAAAIHRWEILTRPAPELTEPDRNGRPRLAARFVEWMMGLPSGWVTDVPDLGRTETLRALGNGVVPQQATHGLATMATWQEATG